MNNYSETMTERTVSQYNGSPIFLAFLSSLAVHADELETEVAKVNSKRVLGAAEGKQLDIIGRIVGIPREVVDFQTGVFFGFSGDPTGLGFDDLNNVVTDAGRYRGLTEATGSSRLLGDEEYTALLTAKILANTSDLTPNSVLLITRELMKVFRHSGENIPIFINETGNASFDIIIQEELSASEQAFIAYLDLIPRPAGVKISYVYETPPNNLLTNDGLALFYQDGTEMEIQF